MSRRKKINVIVLVLVAAGAAFIFSLGGPVISLTPVAAPEPPKLIVIDPNADIEPQKPLATPPSPIKAIYATNWSASSAKKVDYFFDLLNTTELNAIVLDIKDYTGIVGYEPDVASVKEYKAFEKRIPKINALIKRFHDAGVYVIGRIAVFQDGALVKARPDLALHNSQTGAVWGDDKNVHWLDTAAPAVWDYNIDIARDALARGFDEINFDYIRFPTDGKLDTISYPYYKAEVSRRRVLAQFFDHVREELPYARISADIFGEAVVNNQETTIGQFFEDTLAPFDYVAPMIYPSHFNPRFLGLANAAATPYPVIRYSMDRAFDRFVAYERHIFDQNAATSTPAEAVMRPLSFATLRPWLQDFNLGATYTPALVRAQITAVDDSARAAAGCLGVTRTDSNHQVATEPSGSRPACDYQPIGWMLWNASNNYTKAALLPKTATITGGF